MATVNYRIICVSQIRKMKRRDNINMSADIRKELALRIGTSVDNIEENNGIYYLCVRAGKSGVIAHKIPVFVT
ncbi:hypothetical protein D3C75_1364140 [compost metagenome]